MVVNLDTPEDEEETPWYDIVLDETMNLIKVNL